MNHKKKTGARGEELAAEYLVSEGYTITAHDEIDIIAENEGYIVFAEVKTRAQTSQNKRYGRPAAAVNYAKSQKLIRSAEEYLRENPTAKQPRIDVIEVYFPAIHEDTPIDISTLRATGIKHIRNAVTK